MHSAASSTPRLYWSAETPIWRKTKWWSLRNLKMTSSVEIIQVGDRQKVDPLGNTNLQRKVENAWCGGEHLFLS